MIKRDKYPELKGFLGGNFYQCFNEFDDRPASKIVEDSLKLVSTEALNALNEEINELLRVIDNVSGVDDIIASDLACNYDPKYDGLANIEWLVLLKKMIEEQAKDT